MIDKTKRKVFLEIIRFLEANFKTVLEVTPKYRQPSDFASNSDEKSFRLDFGICRIFSMKIYLQTYGCPMVSL